MKKIIQLSILVFISFFVFQSCQKDADDEIISTPEDVSIQNFI